VAGETIDEVRALLVADAKADDPLAHGGLPIVNGCSCWGYSLCVVGGAETALGTWQ